MEIQASNPIVPFRETAVKAPDMAPPKTANAPRGTMHGSASHSLATFTVRAVPMPAELTEYLQRNQSIIARLEREMHDHVNGNQQQVSREDETEEELAVAHGELVQKPTVKLEDFWSTFAEVAKKAGGEWERRASHVWAFGPNRIGQNLLLDCRSEGERW